MIGRGGVRNVAGRQAGDRGRGSPADGRHARARSPIARAARLLLRSPRVCGRLARAAGVTCAALLALAGCDGSGLPRSAADRAAMTALVGHWHWRYRELPDDTRVEVLTTRTADGRFDEQSVASLPDGRVRTQQESGTWMVQDGVLKMRSWTLDGEPVAKNSRFAFRIYEVVEVAPDRVRLRPSAENGTPGLWPRVTGVPRKSREEMPLVEQVRRP